MSQPRRPAAPRPERSQPQGRAHQTLAPHRLPLSEPTMKRLKPVTPGQLLREEFLIPMATSQYHLAKEIGVPAQRISEIVAGKRAVTADTDLRLCRFFGLSKGYWLRA